MTTDTLATVDDTELGQLRRACASYVEVLAARDTEIKRLQAYVAEILGRPVLMSEWEQQQSEIKRLRDLLQDWLKLSAQRSSPTAEIADAHEELMRSTEQAVGQ